VAVGKTVRQLRIGSGVLGALEKQKVYNERTPMRMELGLALGFICHVRSHGFGRAFAWDGVSDWERNGIHLDCWVSFLLRIRCLKSLSTDSEVEQQPYYT